MRPAGGTEKFTTASEVVDGQIRVVVNALDKNDEFLNFLGMSATAVGPDLKAVPMKMTQTAPGRYVGTMPAGDSGSYFIVVGPGAGMAPIRTGVTVPYSDEFRDLATNDALLGQLAALVPKGGAAGKVIEAAGDTARPWSNWPRSTPSATICPRRPAARTSGITWCWLACCLFFGDVFIRRVQVNLAWVPPLAGRARDFVLRRRPPPAAAADHGSAAEPQGRGVRTVRAASGARRASRPRRRRRPGWTSWRKRPPAPPAGPAPPQPPLAQQKAEEESYTERLLRAKKKVWKERKRDEGQGPGTRD